MTTKGPRLECSQDLETFMIYKNKKVFVRLFYLSKEILVFKDQGELLSEFIIDISTPATFSQNQKNPSQLDIQSSNVTSTGGSMLDGMGNVNLGNVVNMGKGIGEGIVSGKVISGGNIVKKEFKFKAASEEKVKEWCLHLMNSQNGNPTPEQRKEKAREMLLMKELKAKRAQEQMEGGSNASTSGNIPIRPANNSPQFNQSQSPRNARPIQSQSPQNNNNMNQQRGQNSGSSDFIPVGGTRNQPGFQSGTIKGNPSRERAQKRTGKMQDMFNDGSQGDGQYRVVNQNNNNNAQMSTSYGSSLGSLGQDKTKASQSSEEEQTAFIKRIKNFKKFGCESIDSPSEFRQRIAAVYNQFDKEREKSNLLEHFQELTMDAVFSLSGIILRCYLVDDDSGKWNWKVESNPNLPIILDSFEEIYLSEPGDQTFVLLQTDVNILMIRFQADTKKWALVLAKDDEPNIAFNTADMMNITFPWSSVYTTVQGGLPKKVILNIEQQVRPRLPMEPLQQERVQLLVKLFDSISSIVVQLIKCFRSLPRIHALEDIKGFTDNSTIGPLIYDSLIPSLIELMMDNFDTWTLFGVHHFWDYVVNCTTDVAVHDHVVLLFNSTVSKIQNTRWRVNEGQDVNAIRSQAFFCLALTYNQLSNWLTILFSNQKQTFRFYKNTALWRTSYSEILELLKLLDGIPFQLTGLPPSKDESEEAMKSWFDEAKEEIALQARAVLEVQLAEFGYELPQIELEIEQTKLTFETDIEKEYDEFVTKAQQTYNELEPEIENAKEAFFNGAEDFVNAVTEFFEDESSYF